MPIYLVDRIFSAIRSLDQDGVMEMRLLRKIKFVAFLMVFAVLAGQFCIVNANAAQGVEAAPIGTKLSGFRIIDLDKPVAGKTLDFKARVRTNENVTWEIPVIWTDEEGHTAYTAQPGKTYYPNFAFYIPDGYSIDAKALAGKLLVRLPDFLMQQFGESSVLFATDAGLGITYITFAQAVAAAAEKRSETSNAAISPAPVSTAQTSSSTDSADRGSDGDRPAPAPAPDPAPAPVVPISETVRIHCSQDIIDKYSNCPEVLEDLVTLIKNKLEPQAVNHLKNSFGAYYYAEDNAFGQNIGLYIYNKTGEIDGTTPPADALAFVSARYFKEDGADVFKYLVAIDTDSFMKCNETTGVWEYVEREKVNLDNTIVHEMMHAYMDDYTRCGMLEDRDYFPAWFTEGMAVTTENVYQFRSYGLQSMGLVDTKDYDKTLERYADPVEYNTTSVWQRYTADLTGNDRYDLKYSNDEKNGCSAYVSGYLAVVYLGYLAAVHDGECTVTNNYVDTDAIRDGLSTILKMIHDGWSLDSVVRYISTPNSVSDNEATYTNNITTWYNGVTGSEEREGTDGFQYMFIKGTDEANPSIYTIASGDTEREVLGSLAFTTTFLSYLEHCSSPGDSSNLANGSVLRQNQNYQSPLNWNDEPESAIYVITDDEGAGRHVASTVDDNRVFYHTGGLSNDHFPDEAAAEGANANVVAFPGDGGENTGLIAASVASPSGEETSAASDTGSSSDTSAASETASASDTAIIPETSSGSDTVAVGETPVAADPASADSTYESSGIPAAVDASATPEMPAVGLDAGQELYILPTEIDAITPDEIAPATCESTNIDEPAPPSDCGSSSDDASSSDDSSSDDSSSSDSSDSADSGNDEGGE